MLLIFIMKILKNLFGNNTKISIENTILNAEIVAPRTIDTAKVSNGTAMYEYIDFGTFYIVTISIFFNSATSANSTGVWVENFIPENLRPRSTLLFDMTSVTQQRNRFKVAITAGGGQLNCYDSSIPVNATALEYVGTATYMVLK